ncbi:hypothetical protein E3T43_17870 [Cryobacterium sp. Hh7]|uniref:hypothetical protein n=1 Tax=Cryobacterium sp. Hh7 TaxID=1259159 RepID=UPI00106B3994|nr:hypothetical protein [Cryobacterium sp. Hh7]TFD50706.1 hypothetical protein E3T43_17870 [Cryobacterium sp. Hh7]
MMVVPFDEYWAMVVADWHQAGTMRARWLPKVWREVRAIYRLNYTWWADMTSTELRGATEHLDSGLTELGGTGVLTVAHVTGDDRDITTWFAGW